ncbi:hypothetical protein Pmani_028235 [Petrolisthes manimaculis]|uniref:Uncharacterized protein n=1 Tax=Petrolisthes manimaculis TaxID=1843537 RepID=A0AAE1P1H5_9EUCA|nr:hypothetical protein Pmani_028235 [Petrolisthes manimaculis]
MAVVAEGEHRVKGVGVHKLYKDNFAFGLVLCCCCCSVSPQNQCFIKHQKVVCLSSPEPGLWPAIVDVGGGVVAEVTTFNVAFEVAADEEATAVDAAAEVPAFEVATLLDAAAEVVASAAEAATVLVAGGDASGVAGAGEVRGEVAAGAADE